LWVGLLDAVPKLSEVDRVVLLALATTVLVPFKPKTGEK
jgi:hypothetical protein